MASPTTSARSDAPRSAAAVRAGVRPTTEQRSCDRPLCSGRAMATLTYDYETASVRLGPVTAESHPMQHDLCERHADRLVVPRGWEVEDRRRSPEPLFRVRTGVGRPERSVA